MNLRWKHDVIHLVVNRRPRHPIMQRVSEIEEMAALLAGLAVHRNFQALGTDPTERLKTGLESALESALLYSELAPTQTVSVWSAFP